MSYNEREIAECNAIEGAQRKLHYLKFNPQQDTWKQYLQALEYAIAERFINMDNISSNKE